MDDRFDQTEWYLIGSAVAHVATQTVTPTEVPPSVPVATQTVQDAAAAAVAAAATPQMMFMVGAGGAVTATALAGAMLYRWWRRPWDGSMLKPQAASPETAPPAERVPPLAHAENETHGESILPTDLSPPAASPETGSPAEQAPVPALLESEIHGQRSIPMDLHPPVTSRSEFAPPALLMGPPVMVQRLTLLDWQLPFETQPPEVRQGMVPAAAPQHDEASQTQASCTATLAAANANAAAKRTRLRQAYACAVVAAVGVTAAVSIGLLGRQLARVAGAHSKSATKPHVASTLPVQRKALATVQPSMTQPAQPVPSYVPAPSSSLCSVDVGFEIMRATGSRLAQPSCQQAEVYVLRGIVRPPLPTSSRIFRVLPRQ